MTGQRLLFWKLAKRSPCGESRSPGWGVLRTKSVTWKTPRDYLVYEFVLSCVRTFSTLWIVARQASLSTGFSRQEFWSVLPFPPWGDLPEPGIKPTSCVALNIGRQILNCRATRKPRDHHGDVRSPPLPAFGSQRVGLCEGKCGNTRVSGYDLFFLFRYIQGW